MKKIYINDLNKYLEKEIELEAFIDKIRDLQYVQFVILRDISGKVQLTIEKNEENQKLVDIISSLNIESTIKIKAKVFKNEKVKLNQLELIPSDITITSTSLNELPFDYKNKTSALIDTKLDYRYLDLRSDDNHLMFQIQSCFINAMRNYLNNQHFIEIHTPKLIGTASESGSEVFEVKYFESKAYLAQSPQFYKQMAITSGFEKVYEVGPVFRAENSNTNRHATEFTSFDVEFSNIDSYIDVMDFEEDLLIAGISKVKEVYGEKIKEVFKTDVIIPSKPFPRIKLQDLYNELEQKYHYSIPNDDIGDMNSETEKLTSKFAKEKFGHEFIFVTDYSATKRAFYHLRKDGIPQGYDLIWRGCEITTGAQREHRYDKLKEQAMEKGLNNDVRFYLNFFKYGCPTHGGFALGVDRLTMLLLEKGTVKDTMFIFRGPNRIEP